MQETEHQAVLAYVPQVLNIMPQQVTATAAVQKSTLNGLITNAITPATRDIVRTPQVLAFQYLQVNGVMIQVFVKPVQINLRAIQFIHQTAVL